MHAAVVDSAVSSRPTGLLTKPYGATFLYSLPECPRVVESPDLIILE